MDVMSYICSGCCMDCDEDVAKCLNQGYCEYDGPEDENGD